ncbi:hybrid sensor histidine kinase/response regulator [Limisalsivibrio acetivorans]|uniref:hybrid sensor histidine kinase/response regulator n=1 Tax=Limisalsivibrio acetivorans TaxID=1304888 RepID=UPI0003B6B612|nr:hybrid sensor histidine kinase/response regulator [Limisalsivibrio acetivorans]
MPLDDEREIILVVDDEPVNISLLTECLKRDYEVESARSGREALDKIFSGNPPALVLLDIMMPGMDGFEVCRRIKEDSRSADIPVIFITAMGDPVDEEKGLELGAIDYLTKPVNTSKVRMRVRNHVESIRMRQSIEEKNNQLLEAARLREDVERITKHDLKQPLVGIMNVPDLLLMSSSFSEEEKMLLEKIRESANTMLHMINRSHDLLRMELGTYNLKKVSVDLIEICDKSIEDLMSYATRIGVEVMLTVNGCSCYFDAGFFVPGERLLCYTMVGNLLKNAVEASPKGGRVHIRLNEVDDVKRLEIENSGLVPENLRDCFFDKYSTCGKEHGTGLGTYSAWLTAKTVGANMGFESVDGTTKVWVDFPQS